ncbi:MAG: hypothetical protein ACK4IX_05700 [Candidatus Sericytochromatia bacterium]
MLTVFKNNIEKLERLTKRERLGELLVRNRIVTISKLVELMDEHKNCPISIPFGEFLVEKEIINRRTLIDYLNLQKQQDNIIDKCLDELGLMTNEKKWELLTRPDKVGEILVKVSNLKLGDLVKALEQQENVSPEMLLGEILLENKYITEEQLKVSLELQKSQNSTLMKIIQEITNVSQMPIKVKVRYMNSLFGSSF